MQKAFWVLTAWMVCGSTWAISLPRTVTDPVDINRASVTKLMQLPGMTSSWAGRIVRFRPYRTKLDLLEQGVVSQEVYQRIREEVIAHRVGAAAVGRKKRSAGGQDSF